jgi:hypothetical protein
MSPILERGDLFFFYRPRIDTDRIIRIGEAVPAEPLKGRWA